MYIVLISKYVALLADILVLGVGERDNMKKIDSKIMRHLRANKINVELLPTVSLWDLILHLA